jgi:hypothetical protein
MFETIFYITGSIFFILFSTALAIIIIYSLKILQKAVSIEVEIKNSISEIKNKIASFSFGFAAMVSLLERLVDLKNGMSGKKKRKDDGNSDNNEDGGETQRKRDNKKN